MIQVKNSKEIKINQEFIAYMSVKTLEEKNLAFRNVGSLTKNINDGNVLFAVDGEKIIGWIETYQLWKNWWGLSSLYVEPEYRDKGVGRQKLLPAAIKKLTDKYIYAATSNSLVWDVLLKNHFQETTLSGYPYQLIFRLWLLRYTNLQSLKKLFYLSTKKIHYFYRLPQ